MSITDQLASKRSQRGDQANINLATHLVKQDDSGAIKELVECLNTKESSLQSDCIKTLYEIGSRNPRLIEPFAEQFLNLLRSKNNRLVWGGMMALATIAEIQADQIYPKVEIIKKSIKTDSTITKDADIATLAGLARAREDYSQALLPFLLDHLRTCRPASVAQHAEKTAIAITSQTVPAFLAVLHERLPDLTPPQAKRVQKLITSFEKGNR